MIHTHTNTHTHTYIYIYTYKQKVKIAETIILKKLMERKESMATEAGLEDTLFGGRSLCVCV
jgi:hypothetical protein